MHRIIFSAGCYLLNVTILVKFEEKLSEKNANQIKITGQNRILSSLGIYYSPLSKFFFCEFFLTLFQRSIIYQRISYQIFIVGNQLMISSNLLQFGN